MHLLIVFHRLRQFLDALNNQIYLVLVRIATLLLNWRGQYQFLVFYKFIYTKQLILRFFRINNTVSMCFIFIYLLYSYN
uniref:Membrane protein n=1 Tax=Staphylococcus haemolyticus TaxID=1283 RepID=A0A060PVV9_STAHA|nr:membrane protein [Staphylococcus haemolyticus]